MKNLLLICCAFFSSRALSAQFDWQHTDGPAGSSYSELFSNEKFAFLPERDFLFRTSDGISWEKITQPVSNVFAVRHDTLATLFEDPISGILYVNVSQDNGLHWQQHRVSGKITLYNSSIAITSTNLNIALEGKTRIYRSADLGITWDSTYYPGQNTSDVVSVDDRIYTYGGGLLIRSDRDGNNWKDISPPLFANEFITSLASAQDSIIWVLTDDRIWKSTDSGKGWTYKVIFPFNSNTHLVITHDQVFAVSSTSIFGTSDQGNSWDTLVLNNTDYDFYKAAGIGETLLVSKINKGIFRYDQQTQSLKESNTGLGKGYILELVANQDHIWANGLNGIYTYDLLTKKWDRKLNIEVPFSGFNYISVNNNGWVLLPGNSSDVQLSQDNGNTWKEIDVPQNGIGPNRVQLLGNSIVVIDDFYVTYSSDQGETWENVIGEPVSTEIVSSQGNYFVAGDNRLYESSDGHSWLIRITPFEIQQLGAYKDQLYSIGKTGGVNSLYVSDNEGIDWSYAGPGYYSGFLFPYYFHDTYLRDADHFYSLLGNGGSYVTDASDFASDTIPYTVSARDYLAIGNVLFRGGDGMYETTIEDPYITSVAGPQPQGEPNLSISPNPVADHIQITLPSCVKWNGELSVFSSDGKTCFSSTIHSADDLEITTTIFSAGWYRVVYKNESNLITGSFVKQ